MFFQNLNLYGENLNAKGVKRRRKEAHSNAKERQFEIEKHNARIKPLDIFTYFSFQISLRPLVSSLCALFRQG